MKITDDDTVFLLRGDDDEIYMIDDPVMVRKLEAKVKELSGMSDNEIGRRLLAIVNPDKYRL